MDYQVWTKDEYTEGWKKVDCGDAPAVQREIEKAVRAGKEPLVTLEVPYDVTIKLKEALIGEAKKSKTKLDKGPGAESDSEVRRGDESPTEELDQGSGDLGSGTGTGD